MDRLKLFTLAPEQVELPNGKKVYLRRLTAGERLDWFEALNRQYSEEELGKRSQLRITIEDSLKVIGASLVDQNGDRLFKESEVGEILKFDSPLIDFLIDQILYLNALTAKGKEDAKKKPSPDKTTTTS